MSGNFDQTKEDLQRTVREVIRILMYRRWAFVVPFCVGASVVFIFSHRLPREYKAQTIFERRNPIPISKVLERSGPVSLENIHDSFNYDIMGEEPMLQVADAMGLTKGLPRKQDGGWTRSAEQSRRGLARKLRGMLDYAPLKVSPELDRIEIMARGGDPDLVVSLVNQVRDNYFEHSRNRFLNRLREAREFYLGEIETLMASVDLHEKEIEQLQEKFPYVNPDTSRLAISRATTTEENRKRLDGKIEEHRRKISRLEALLASMPVPRLIQENGSYTMNFLDNEADMERERRRLMQYIMSIENSMTLKSLEDGMLPRHPEMKKLGAKKEQARLELAAINKQLGNEDDGQRVYTADPAVAEIQRSERQRLTTELADTRTALAVAEEHHKTAKQTLTEHERLRRESYDKRVLYRKMQQSLGDEKATIDTMRADERKLSRVLEIDAKDQGIEFITVQEAGTSRQPVSPRAKAILMLALGVGAACGACVVFLREFFDHTFHTASSVNVSLGVTVLEGIDEILLPVDRRRILMKKLTMVPVACLFLGVLATSGGLAYLSLEHPQKYKRIVEKAASTWDDQGAMG